MKFGTPLKRALIVAVLLFGVLGSVALWPNDERERAAPASAGDRAAISTATPAPTETPTPVPSGVVVEVVRVCTMRHLGGGLLNVQDDSGSSSQSSCMPPFPPGLIVERETVQITVLQEGGSRFETFRAAPFSIAAGDSWPPE